MTRFLPSAQYVMKDEATTLWFYMERGKRRGSSRESERHREEEKEREMI